MSSYMKVDGYINDHSPLSVKVMTFAKQFFPKEENTTPEFHYELLDLVDKGALRQLVCCFRGSAKSTIFTKWLPLYASFFGSLEDIETDFILIVSDTTSQAEDMIREIKDLYDCCSVEFKQLLKPHKTWRSDEVEFVNARGHVTNIVAKGAGQKVRGIKRRGKRPSYLIIDDLENDEAVLNEQNRRKLKDWFYKALLPCLSPTKSKIFYAGTPLHSDSLLENLRYDKKWEKAEFPIEDKDGNPLWENRFSKKWIEEKKSEMKAQRMLTSYYQEYMLEIMSDEDQIFKPHYFKYVSISDVPDDLDIYITCDLAISEAKTADRTAFTVCGVDTTNTIYLLDIFAERIPPSKQVSKLAELCQRYYKKGTPVTLGIEMVSYQKSFETMWEKYLEKMIHIRHMIPRIQELKPDAKKERRIQQLEMFFYRNQIKMVKSTYSHLLEEELLMFPRAKHDDISDAFAYLLQLVRWRQGDTQDVDEYWNKNSMPTGMAW
jgi:phage terminase large subunit-like protein